MRRLVEAVYRVAALPGYVAATLAYAPPIAAIEQPSLGVFNGFDFHMTPEGPRSSKSARVLQPPCCPGESSLLEKRENGGRFEADFVAAFLSDWRLSRANTPLRTIAIVDDDPKTQYLYPEFLLYRQLFERHGYEALIADASALEFSDGTLSFAGRRIDLVYNRLTDFYLDDPNHTAIR